MTDKYLFQERQSARGASDLLLVLRLGCVREGLLSVVVSVVRSGAVRLAPGPDCDSIVLFIFLCVLLVIES